jgi:hypothetical protein
VSSGFVNAALEASGLSDPLNRSKEHCMASDFVHAVGWAALWTAAIGFHTSAYGQIGETLAQCENRYGPQIGQHNGSAGFRKGGYFIFVRFFEGRADAILFCKEGNDARNRPEPISADEIQSLLDVSSNGQHWSASHAVVTGLRWAADDGALVADYGTLDHCLVILTKEHVERASGKVAAGKADKLQGW